MNSMANRVQLIGLLGNDPEIKNLENDNKVANFRMATNEYRKNAQGDKITETQWHYVVAWGKTADIIERFAHKGNRVGVEGKLVTRSYDDKDGVKKYVTEVVANEVLLLSGKE